MCGPNFCSMKISQDVRDYAAKQGVSETEVLTKGMEEKSMLKRVPKFITTVEPLVAINPLDDIQRAANGEAAPFHNMRIYLCGLDILVAQQFLQCSNVRSAFQ